MRPKPFADASRWIDRSRARPPAFDGAWIDAPADAEGYARDLYANLRALDGARADAILVVAPPPDEAWHAVRDRLARATHRAGG